MTQQEQRILRLITQVRGSMQNELQKRPLAKVSYNIVVRDLTFDYLAAEGSIDELQRYSYDKEQIEVILDALESFIWKLTTIGYTHFALRIQLEDGRIAMKNFTSTFKYQHMDNKVRISK